MAMNRLVMQIDGAKELQAKLDTLSHTEEKGVFRSALRDSQKLMQTFGKGEAASQIGGAMGAAIAQHIILRSFKKRKKYSVGFNVMSDPAWVEPSHKTGTPDVHDTSPIYLTESTGLRQYIPAAIEYGHIVRTGKTGGMTKGARKRAAFIKSLGLSRQRWVAPIPYMRTASKMSETGRFRILAEKITKYIERIWAKRAATALYEAQLEMIAERSTGDEL